MRLEDKKREQSRGGGVLGVERRCRGSRRTWHTEERYQSIWQRVDKEYGLIENVRFR